MHALLYASYMLQAFSIMTLIGAICVAMGIDLDAFESVTVYPRRLQAHVDLLDQIERNTRTNYLSHARYLVILYSSLTLLMVIASTCCAVAFSII